MIDGAYSVVFALLFAAAILAIAAVRQRRRAQEPAHDSLSLPDGVRLAIVALHRRHAQRWAKRQGLQPEQYYFVESSESLTSEDPCYYVAVDSFDQREDWPALFATLTAKGYERWWPPVDSSKTDSF